MSKRDFDVVLWGATGYTGKLVAEHLMETYGTGKLRWALAGRSQQKLEAVRRELGSEASELAILLGDSQDRASLERIAQQSSVVCSTVGPYARYGSELVAACAAAGTHYCDITGETQWVRRMIDAHEDTAKQSGARLVSFCGVDSIPSDLGCLLLDEWMRAEHGGPCSEAKLLVERLVGGFSGGSVLTILDVLAEARSDPSARRTLMDPYGLNPEGERSGPDQLAQLGVRYDADTKAWTAPFLMESVNAKVVRRSNALLGFRYGRDFRYREAMLTGRGPRGLAKAAALSAAIGAGTAAAVFPPTRALLTRFIPGPGEGMSAEARRRGHFAALLIGKRDGAEVRLRISGDRDPGYGATARMLGESAVCLARDALDVGGGYFTPASAMGKALVARLEQKAGMRFASA